MEIRTFGRVTDAAPVPVLNDLQKRKYAEFLQANVHPKERANSGLEGLFREVFPIESYDGTLKLEYVRYELGRPRYSIDECRKLNLTYAMPLKIVTRLTLPEPLEENVYLGEMPVMVAGCEFVINGAERVVVTQLHRSPGVDFDVEVHPTGKRLYSCRIVPDRGSWIEMTASIKDIIHVRIDRSGKFPATCLLRALDERLSTTPDIIRYFYKTAKIRLSSDGAGAKLRGKTLVSDVVNKKTGTVIMHSGEEIPTGMVRKFRSAGVATVEVITDAADPLILNTLKEDKSDSHEAALLRIYSRLRPGNPANADKARALLHERFYDNTRFRLGRVGRFRLNRKFSQPVDESITTLTPEDVINCMNYFMTLRAGNGQTDDIDHLGNRRVRTINELLSDEVRKGLLKLRRTVQERMSLKGKTELSPRSLINYKTVSSAIDYFFARSELSQLVDQTNPLAQLTNERRLSALGPGGLHRKRAGFEVRDVHPSHYGRICPIETPEGTNIGLIVYLSLFAGVDEYGFLTTPYAKAARGKPGRDLLYLRADQEEQYRIAPADAIGTADDLMQDTVLARHASEYAYVPTRQVDLFDVSSKQLVGVSAGLIPFLEHDDANRALMGSNMQRQALPLLTTEPPLIATGMEKVVAQNSNVVVRAERSGKVTNVDSSEIVIDDRDRYHLQKFVRLNEGICLDQRPIVKHGERVSEGQIIADGASIKNGELSLGKNFLVAFMSWEGCNFEDAILLSERVVREDRFTSIHIEELSVDVRETQLGREEITRDIPNVAEKALGNLDESGVVLVGTNVVSGDILVGKIAPKSKKELSPEEKLLHAIFGRAGEDVKNESLVLPGGVEGVVIATERYSRKTSLSPGERKGFDKDVTQIEEGLRQELATSLRVMARELREAMGGRDLISKTTGQKISLRQQPTLADLNTFDEALDIENLIIPASRKKATAEVFRENMVKVEAVRDDYDRKLRRIRWGSELPTGVLEKVKVYIATKRTVSVGDKISGRHGNKGVIAKIVPDEDMPFLADGTPVDIVLNPLGVPSRMNVGQILETHLGWAAHTLGFRAITPVFDGISEEKIRELLKEAGLPEDGKAVLYDGRTGDVFDQRVTVGYIYMMKLNHLVDDKVHARATGPYSLITQQPLGGKSRAGGQRFGEMEVWALEAYGAAHILQELLTVKSDDVDGRGRMYESMVKGENTLQAGPPASFHVLANEIRGLGFNMKLNKKDVFERKDA